MASRMTTVDGNYAAAHVAYAYSEVAAIYPITPSSPMGEYADEWAAENETNIFGKKLSIVEMESEGGAAGAVHGSLTAGALTTTFTASQGLMLMLPNMYKIAGEMLPTVIHVSARSLACQSLSIFGDHSDVMAARATGFAMTAAASIQEVQDLAIVAHLATLKSQVPFLAFFDGFRTSHEVQKVDLADYETLAKLLETQYLEQFRARALRPEKPTLKVGAQNPDVYFQGRETVNKYYLAVPQIVQEYMDKVAAVLGRQYHLFDYVGAPDAEKVIVAMGSSCDTIEETVNYLNKTCNAKVGAVKVRLYRPFSVQAFVEALPKTVKKIAVLDRTKEPGAIGEPLYLDVATALRGRPNITVIGGRYGLSSKEFSPSMVKAVYDHLDGKCYDDFTVGINDDVTNLSLSVKDEISTEPEGVVRCLFWGLGSDGTVGANKNSIKIIGDNTDMYAQAYFVYDSKKSGGITISHLRFGKNKIQSAYLITQSDFVACHNSAYIGRYDMLKGLRKGGVFLLNSEWDSSEAFEHLTKDMQQTIIDKEIKFYSINALKIAEAAGLGLRINTVMQAAFFIISGVLPDEKAVNLIKGAIQKAYGRKGEDIVKMNWACVDATRAALTQVQVPKALSKWAEPPVLLPEGASQFAKDIIEPLMRLEGDNVPVSKMSYDGTIPTATSKLEKRGIAPKVPHWIHENCIQCNQCAMACPHAVIRAKQIAPADLVGAPEGFTTVDSKTKNDRKLKYRIQVYVEDCTGCGVCVETCPAKVKALEFKALEEMRAAGETKKAEYFENLPDNVCDGAAPNTLKGAQFRKPLFEFSGACAGCGETPYVKLITQLFGERMVIANATGCSSIYGGTFPTVPYCVNKEGVGPSWANSLFEDNAEYGLGMRLAVDSNRAQLKDAVAKVLEAGSTPDLSAALGRAMALWEATDDAAMKAQREVKALLPAALKAATPQNQAALAKLNELQDYFVDKSVWILGGDGWAYDIGYGGLDHVLSLGRNVNVLVLDTEVYSNTGGQASKSTCIGAVAKFANAGKRFGKKHMGLMLMTYGYVYVASVAMGANRNLTLKAMLEAESYNGPSIVFAYAPCIAHGIDMRESQVEQKLAVESGYYATFRYNPTATPKYSWDGGEPKMAFQDFIKRERRYTSLKNTAPDEAAGLFKLAEEDAKRRMDLYKKLGEIL
ncbi:MAG: pyruvate:ferredoxin (flavodoxin) oxidoreductase [Lentisphaerae bacterium RIFOXYB12_FULL_65_16]|nr:MAG: pyruvate:ferredoxin (flavodoxin) oxidoreductase [Lentisphaerae bacterium RIFOXYA12_64_32]OGV85852.1 MAG: pyruvate:ferredoxin (flavodoxin) oxidoreductase [Lentisphaerae bacterium RIFOXYB12_FULL_65_16]